MARTKSGNARSAAINLRTTPQFRRYLEEVCAAEKVSVSGFARECIGFVLQLRRDHAGDAARSGQSLMEFVRSAAKDYAARIKP